MSLQSNSTLTVDLPCFQADGRAKKGFPYHATKPRPFAERNRLHYTCEDFAASHSVPAGLRQTRGENEFRKSCTMCY